MTLFILSLILLIPALIAVLHISYVESARLVRQPLPAYVPFTPRPRHPALARVNDSHSARAYYYAARDARLKLTLEQFFALAFDKAPSPTPASFAELTSKQISTIRGKQQKFITRCEKMSANYF